MNRRWMEKESSRWVDEGIISSVQQERILALYQGKGRSRLLPILASILVGFSILTFIASNWDGMPIVLRFILILAVMSFFYLTGRAQLEKGETALGTGLLLLGLMSFGGGIFLTGQMLNLVSYNAGAFIIWLAAALGVLYLYPSRLLFMTAAVISFAGQLYATASFNQPSVALFVLSTLGLGLYWHKKENTLSAAVLALLTGWHMISVTQIMREGAAWIFALIFLLYTAGEVLLRSRITAAIIQRVALSAAYILAVVMVFLHGDVLSSAGNDFYPSPVFFAGTLIVLGVVCGWSKYSRHALSTLTECILFLPFFYASIGGVLYLLSLFLFSGWMIWSGDREDDGFRTKAGVLLFMISTFTGYFQLAWDFMNKSIFFLLGGILLFAIHFILRRRAAIFGDGGNSHEK